ncbi:phosphatase PAP2 family protein [Paracoccus aurantiacus]|uniref:Phosphatase PAP2 family protein n=1 Tax=Paracoccus aurantiacus TaxID=2599412 RepID=A0A5C6S4M4_9RHOB|nr:phosphatase PAP2 family protein [Paracoccus aurantiacus]TXB69353.1 phosphatase PAP2 family protein [Paracoccus aurantiacus]
MTAHSLSIRLALLSLLGLIIASVLFTAKPQIDLNVSGWFAGASGKDFVISQQRVWQEVRLFFRIITTGTALLMLAFLVHNLLRPNAAIGRNRALAFIVAAYALGPGLIANGFFKSFWGRARPRDIVEFGGTHTFTPALVPTDQCRLDCSFISGEASSAAAISLALLLAAWPRLSHRDRVRGSVAAASFTLFVSGLRIAFGGHFLSDTVFAIVIMGVIVPVVHLIVIGRAEQPGVITTRPPKGA